MNSFNARSRQVKLTYYHNGFRVLEIHSASPVLDDDDDYGNFYVEKVEV